jgi:6-phosphogluconolactonase (cycloisomerase 2 family)
VDPSGKFAYAANYGSANVSAYAINGTTGALTAVAGSPFVAGIFPTSITTAGAIE